MRVLVYGGRDYNNQDQMNGVLDKFHEEYKFTKMINGGQLSRSGEEIFGADWQASVWANKNRIPVFFFCANWRFDEKSAGPIRNQRMMVEGKPEIGIEFPGGKGTKDMRKRLLAAGITIKEIVW